MNTFSSCETHYEWVRLGSDGWPDSTYGDNNKPVAGAMPGFEGILESEEEIRAVVMYERVAFGEEDLAVAEVGCGLVVAAEDAEAAALGE